MITSATTVVGDLAELAELAWEVTSFEGLLDEHGINYLNTYKNPRDVFVAELDENVVWVRFVHDITTIVLHEFHRWYISDNGCVTRQYRVRAEEEVHG